MMIYKQLVQGVCLVLAMVSTQSMAAPFDWDKALKGEHRKASNSARDSFRHPRETLEFFGLEPGMTVMEVSPGGGWYTEILAPLLHNNGRLIAAHYAPNGGSYSRRSLGGFLQKLGEDSDNYGAVEVSFLQPPDAMTPAAPNSVDLAVAFRNVHSWMRMDQVEFFFVAIYDALKPGGTFGIVQHRGAPGTDLDTMKKTAYVTEEQVIEYAELAGFEFVGASEINANAKDTKDYPAGVWTLPPSYAEGDKDRARYEAIGESDRMTLKFRKPQS
jgi:predicted methyltransferase